MDTVNHENTKVRLAFDVSNERVAHYADVIEYMATAAVGRFVSKYGRNPTASQIQFLKKELTRYVVVRKDIDTANKIDIQESPLLNEQDYRVYSRV